MFKILTKRRLNEAVYLFAVDAPLIAKKAKAGQFVILRVDEKGERVPFTIADTDPEQGTVTIIVQVAGLTTRLLANLEEGDSLLDFVGPLGVPTHLDGVKRACVIGGGVGCAIAYPCAKALKEKGAHVDVIAGFRTKELVILEKEFEAIVDRFFVTTDDGSYGEKGFVTGKLQALIDGGADYDLVVAIGPVPMMKFVCATTKPYDIHTLVSLNPIMIDGTGMCGCCRVTVGGKTRFACVEGPDFDGHEVDFDELMNRNSIYREEEAEKDHLCKLGLGSAPNETQGEGRENA